MDNNTPNIQRMRYNKECWKNAFESLKNGIDKDLSDGIQDENWSLVKSKIFMNKEKNSLKSYYIA
jgi:hypothetical protein